MATVAACAGVVQTCARCGIWQDACRVHGVCAWEGRALAAETGQCSDEEAGMAEGQIQTWEEQVCEHCSNDTFVTLVKLRAKPGGGFTTSPGGYACQKCGDKADVARMQRESLRRQRMQELRAMEAEYQEQEAPSVPVPDTGNASLR